MTPHAGCVMTGVTAAAPAPRHAHALRLQRAGTAPMAGATKVLLLHRTTAASARPLMLMVYGS